jgi:hypothetical protein
MRYEVIITNDIIGNSSHTATMEQISKFNLVVKALATQCLADGKEHSHGMWTVRPVKDQCEHCMHPVDKCVCSDDDVCNEMGAR